MIQMLRDRILVKPDIRKLSAILIVKNTEKMNQGEVVSIGPEVLDVSIGDQIKFGNGTYLDFPDWKGPDGTVYKLLQEADVACIVEH